jgi:hypothetical protein
MKLSKYDLKKLIQEEVSTLKETEWDVSKRTAFPRVLSQILSALRELQDIVDGGHLDPKQPASDSDIEMIKDIFEHPAIQTLKKLGDVHVPTTHEEAYGLDIDWSDGGRDVDWDY